ncbi:hypothetical protein FHR83_007130 [Actinoplanes campanulatus]|uniref:Holliday junction resolvase n=1 Tax=Actinoplanes campanulatus TaxID=113559 RepID=A0A7W5AP44_9ACTN|nr:hypothetical protein [Actinoplanes campanulatus]MBB3099424.1 hypothetical protein [Actinoplanes campanulatus]GGN40061.1 hypothetical protein GCM10010109_68620 [Actinoplanes campanulatus]GID42367.1 hypothetical protein Aca09nite_88730 [Actinoplanes campanulatus]
MPSPAANKRKGAQFEIDLMKTLREMGLDAERLRLAGKDDEGDLVLRSFGPSSGKHYVVIEAKSGAMHPAVFVREAEAERRNFARHRGLPLDMVSGVAVVKRPRLNVLDSYVLTTLREYLNLGEVGV